MFELDLHGFDCMSSVIAQRMPGVTKLVLVCIGAADIGNYGYTSVFESLKDLRCLHTETDTCCFSAATSLEVLSWELGEPSAAEVA